MLKVSKPGLWWALHLHFRISHKSCQNCRGTSESWRSPSDHLTDANTICNIKKKWGWQDLKETWRTKRPFPKQESSGWSGGNAHVLLPTWNSMESGQLCQRQPGRGGKPEPARILSPWVPSSIPLSIHPPPMMGRPTPPLTVDFSCAFTSIVKHFRDEVKEMSVCQDRSELGHCRLQPEFYFQFPVTTLILLVRPTLLFREFLFGKHSKIVHPWNMR